jgi:hypothetical protein
MAMPNFGPSQERDKNEQSKLETKSNNRRPLRRDRTGRPIQDHDHAKRVVDRPDTVRKEAHRNPARSKANRRENPIQLPTRNTKGAPMKRFPGYQKHDPSKHRPIDFVSDLLFILFQLTILAVAILAAID